MHMHSMVVVKKSYLSILWHGCLQGCLQEDQIIFANLNNLELIDHEIRKELKLLNIELEHFFCHRMKKLNCVDCSY